MTDPRLHRPLWRGRTNLDALTIGCLEHAEEIVRARAPHLAHLFTVTQGSYQGDGGDPDSGTTHRLGGAVDLRWCGHPVCYRALRLAGLFIWHRTPDQGPWADHYHGAPLGHPLMDPALEAQETDYLNGGDGLGGRDTGPRRNPPPRPVWPWPRKDWFDMADKTDLEQIVAAQIKAATPALVKAILDAPVDQDPHTTVRRALRRAAHMEEEQ